MDRYEKAALLDFVVSVIWPSRTVAVVNNPAGQATFTVNAPTGGWATATDVPMAWINGQRVTGTITWASSTSVTLPSTVPVGSQVVILISPGAGSGYLARSGLAAMLGDLDMGNFQIENLGASVAAHHAVRRDEVMSIVAGLLGGNYVLKAGDQLAGPLLGASAASLTNAAALLRRDMAALLAADASVAERTFRAKVFGVTTVDADEDATLTTKGYVDGLVSSIFGAGALPNHYAVFTTPGADTWTVPADIISPVYVFCRGGGGGGGGGGSETQSDQTAGPGGDGAIGALVAAVVSGLATGTAIPLFVGGGGGYGQGSTGAGGGGGGGGATKFNNEVVAGGGGGGGGGGLRDEGPPSINITGGNGGSGGAAGSSSGGNAGGAAGSGGTDKGGVGGSGGASGGGSDGSSGSFTRGAHAISALSPPLDLMPTDGSGGGGGTAGVYGGTTSGGNGSSGQAGSLLIMWRE